MIVWGFIGSDGPSSFLSGIWSTKASNDSIADLRNNLEASLVY